MKKVDIFCKVLLAGAIAAGIVFLPKFSREGRFFRITPPPPPKSAFEAAPPPGTLREGFEYEVTQERAQSGISSRAYIRDFLIGEGMISEQVSETEIGFTSYSDPRKTGVAAIRARGRNLNLSREQLERLNEGLEKHILGIE